MNIHTGDYINWFILCGSTDILLYEGVYTLNTLYQVTTGCTADYKLEDNNITLKGLWKIPMKSL